jgi:hypothetical protein
LAKSVVAEIVHENNFGLTAAPIIANITGTGAAPVQNFAYPACKNAYGGLVTPVKPAAAAAPGEVGMVATAGLLAPDGSAKTGITVSYIITVSGVNTTETIPVPLD